MVIDRKIRTNLKKIQCTYDIIIIEISEFR